MSPHAAKQTVNEIVLSATWRRLPISLLYPPSLSFA